MATVVVVSAVAASLALTGCQSKRDGNSTSTKKDTLVFGVAGDAKVLDPALASDGESYRVARQVFEGLVMHEEGGHNIVPNLAESWTSDATGLKWTFKLRTGVKFHDGTDFNAEAVCVNFSRWYNWSGMMQSPDTSYIWQDVFGGFAKNESDKLPPSLFKSCSAQDPSTAVIELSRVSSKFPAALAVPSFAMSSPKALKQYEADKLGGSAQNLTYPPYAMEHPVGTGPYKFVKWDRTAKTIELVRNDDYWGTKAKIKTLIFQTISDLTARKQALRNGQIQGYDLVAPADIKPLADEGFNVLTRRPFNLLWLTMNQSGDPALKNIKVRQAIAHAINRQAIIDSKYPPGALLANEFQPPNLDGHNDAVVKYDYNPEKAKSLLAEAGVTKLTLRFHYPTEVTRPYMPAPKDIFELIAADLRKVGIEVKPIPLKWSPDYLNAVKATNEHDLHLLGWTAGYPEAYAFIGSFFDREKPEWGFNNPDLFAKLGAADREPDKAKRVKLYQELNAMIMEYLPGLPIAHGPSSLVVAKNVGGVVASPVGVETYYTAYYTS